MRKRGNICNGFQKVNFRHWYYIYFILIRWQQNWRSSVTAILSINVELHTTLSLQNETTSHITLAYIGERKRERALSIVKNNRKRIRTKAEEAGAHEHIIERVISISGQVQKPNHNRWSAIRIRTSLPVMTNYWE